MDLEQLVAENQGHLFAFLYRLSGDASLAEELMQETFVRAIRAAERYQPNGKVTTWLFAIAANVTRDHWRRTRRGQLVPLDDLPVAGGDSTEEEALSRFSAQEVRTALLSLPLEHRTVLLLRYYHDQSYQEMAEALAIPIGTVRSRIHNGLARLKRTLTNEEVGAR